MKKSILVLFLISILSMPLFAKWNGDGLGNHKARKDLNLNGYSIVTGLNGTFTGNLTVDSPSLFVSSTTHRVGIGTLTPNQKLSVYDGFLEVIDPDSSTSILFSAPADKVTSLLFRSGAANRWSIVRKATTEDFCVYDYSTSTSCVMTFQQGGNIGISTDTPNYRLDVNGVVRSTGIISTGDINATGYKGTFSTIAFSGSGEKAVISYNNIEYRVEISTNLYLPGNATIDGSATINGTINGGVLISSGTYGYIYTDTSSSSTAISASSTYTLVLGTSTAPSGCNSWFTGTNNRLAYNYSIEKHFKGICEVTFTAVAKDKRIGFALFKNGTILAGSKGSVNTNGAGTYNNISLLTCTSMSAGDYIELYVINFSDDTDIVVTDWAFSIDAKD